jgi:DNA-binding transcriptional regulator YiaG
MMIPMTSKFPKPPKPAELAAFRQKHNLSQAAAADLAYVSLRTWHGWERGEARMHPAIWAWVQHSVV